MQGKAPRIGVLVVTLLLAATAAAQDNSRLYRWVDKDGHVHYGDQPAGNNASEVNLRSINTTDSLANDPAKAAAADKQAAACKQKADQFSQYQKASSITETAALGNQHQFSDDEKAQLIAKTQKYLDDNCGGAPAAAPAANAANGAPAAGGTPAPAPQQ